MEIPVGDYVAVMNASAAIRRFDRDDSTVFAYASHGDCGAKRSAKGKFTVVETGWCVSHSLALSCTGCESVVVTHSVTLVPCLVGRIRLMPLPGSPDSCILQSAGHFTPTHCCVPKLGPEDPCSSDSDDKERCADHGVEAGMLSEVIYSAYQKSATFIYTYIENALMQEHIERRRGT